MQFTELKQFFTREGLLVLVNNQTEVPFCELYRSTCVFAHGRTPSVDQVISQIPEQILMFPTINAYYVDGTQELGVFGANIAQSCIVVWGII